MQPQLKTSTLLICILAAGGLAACQKPEVRETPDPIVITVPEKAAHNPYVSDATPITVADAAPGPMADVTPAPAPVPSSAPSSTPLSVAAPGTSTAPGAGTTLAAAPPPSPAPVIPAPQYQPGDTITGGPGIGPQGAPAISGPDGATTIPYPGEPGVVNDRNSTNRIPDR